MGEIEKKSLEDSQIRRVESKDILRNRRETIGLTQQTVADRAGIHLQSYQVFESGKRKIHNASFSIACRVIEALEMDITKFYRDEYSVGKEISIMKDGARTN